MKNVISFRIDTPKKRNPLAKEVLDRDGPYRARRVRSAIEWRRKPKHINRELV